MTPKRVRTKEELNLLRKELTGKIAVVTYAVSHVKGKKFVITSVDLTYWNNSGYVVNGTLVDSTERVNFGKRSSFELVEDQAPDRMEEYGEEGW